jgi:hypothetical protein
VALAIEPNPIKIKVPEHDILFFIFISSSYSTPTVSLPGLPSRPAIRTSVFSRPAYRAAML